VSVLSVIYLFAVVLVALYGANALLLAALYVRRRRQPVRPAPEPETWPVVSVQLPIYNEMYVVERLINAVAGLDYPHDRLQVQVLDDSTDETTRLAEACVAHHRARGLEIELVHRENRDGFKAGALANGLKTAQGELIAVFDADFVPPPGFMRQTVPHLIANLRLGFVQTRWGYLNAGYSVMTRAQTLALDGHFVVEHMGRNRNGLLVNFNGTAGVWRRAAIEGAGGWQSDTLTEDVDLSFRAQLAGWQALYLPEVEAPAELPPQMAAFKRQQARWATGAAQCLVKLAGSLWHGRLTGSFQTGTGQVSDDASRRGQPQALPWQARLEGLLHLSVWFAHPMSLVLLLLTLPMLLGRIPLTFNLTIFWLMALGPILTYALSQRHLYPDWGRACRPCAGPGFAGDRPGSVQQPGHCPRAGGTERALSPHAQVPRGRARRPVGRQPLRPAVRVGHGGRAGAGDLWSGAGRRGLGRGQLFCGAFSGAVRGRLWLHRPAGCDRCVGGKQKVGND